MGLKKTFKKIGVIKTLFCNTFFSTDSLLIQNDQKELTK